VAQALFYCGHGPLIPGDLPDGVEDFHGMPLCKARQDVLSMPSLVMPGS